MYCRNVKKANCKRITLTINIYLGKRAIYTIRYFSKKNSIFVWISEAISNNYNFQALSKFNK